MAYTKNSTVVELLPLLPGPRPFRFSLGLYVLDKVLVAVPGSWEGFQNGEPQSLSHRHLELVICHDFLVVDTCSNQLRRMQSHESVIRTSVKFGDKVTNR